MIIRQPLFIRPLVRPSSPARMLASLLALLAVIALLVPGTAWAVEWARSQRGGQPEVIAAGPTVNPDGGPVTLTRTVVAGDLPPTLDLFLLVDVSASYRDDLPQMREAVPELVERLGRSTDGRVGLASFSDRTSAPADHVYDLEAKLGSTPAELAEAVDGLDIGDGGDVAEASLEALDQLLLDPETQLRSGAPAVVVLATDAEPHVPGTSAYRGRPLEEIEADLLERGISLVLVSPDESLRERGVLADLVELTGGSAQPVDADGADLADAVADGLERIPAPVTPSADCPGFSVTFSPAIRTETGPVKIRIEPRGAPRGRHHCELGLGSTQERIAVEGSP